jgi:LAS superfamily LD-carboxypeptidase LdcB
MKRLIACLLVFAAVCFFVPAIAEEPITAEELYAKYPVPEMSITSDPSAEPNLKLVNKKNDLPWDYVPELVVPNIQAKKNVKIELSPEAAKALEELFADAQAEGLKLVAISGYRSYSTQKAIYQRSVEKNGKSHADLSSAKAGKSEHQLGLAVDVSCDAIKLNLNKSFASTKEGKWLYEHCAEFGFIVRYKTEWVKTTGYKGEPWHIRYVGKEHAGFITKLNVPFDTYMAYLQLVWENGIK